MSTFVCEVVSVVLEKHPDPETISLSVVKVFDGYTCVVRTEDWIGIEKAVYIPPDSIVPNTEQFAWLEGHLRIKAKRLRGVQSYGMLIPAPEGSKIGDNVAEQLGIIHYEPELPPSTYAQFAINPPMPGHKYDIESWHKYRKEFILGEEVVITEKIHGANARFTFQLDQGADELAGSGKATDMIMYIGSHNHWIKPGKHIYSYALEQNPWIEAFCRLNPNVILYGEIFGSVQKGFNYGSIKNNSYQFRAFDVFAGPSLDHPGGFLSYDDALGSAKSDFLVPVLYRGPYSHEIVEELMNGPSTFEGASHIREGVVIKPTKEQFSYRLGGRLILKAVSVDYLAGKKKR